MPVNEKKSSETRRSCGERRKQAILDAVAASRVLRSSGRGRRNSTWAFTTWAFMPQLRQPGNHCQAHRNGLYCTDDLSFYPRQMSFITRRVEVPASVTGPKCLSHLHSAFLSLPYLIRCSDYVYNVKCVQFGKKTPWPAFFV